jgi:shikimate 5-dehydrogenase
LGLPARCLPLGVGDKRLFGRVIDAAHLAAVVVDDKHRAALGELATELEPAARQTNAADVLVRQDDKWHGYNALSRAAVAALETQVKASSVADKLHNRLVLIVGANAAAWTLAFAVKKRGGIPIIASHDRDGARRIAQAFGCRQVPFEALYSTMHDVLVVCSEEKDEAPARGRPAAEGVQPGYLRPGMTVLDLTALPRKSTLLKEAAVRGCSVVPPREVVLNHLGVQVHLIAGQDVPREVLAETFDALVDEES